MRKQRGSLLLYGALGAGVIIAGLTLTTTLYRNALQTCRANHERFVTEVEVKGELAKQEAKAENARLRQAKESADEKAKRLVAELNAARSRLRDKDRTISRLVPRIAEATGTADPTRACYQRDALSGALQRFVEGVAGLVESGDDFRIDSVVARGWIKDLSRR